MATLSSVGISGSGLDESVITKLVAVQKQPITDLNSRTDAIKTKLSTYGQIQSALSTLRDAASKLTNPSTWSGSKTATSDASVAIATASSSAVGTVSLSVSQLASAQTLAGPTLSGPTATLGQGTVTLELGTWGTDSGGATTFTSKSGTTPTSVSIAAGDSLATIRDKINGASAGVTAAIVTDATGSRLTLTSSQTGETNAFRVTVADGDGNSGDASGLSQLAYDPSGSVSQMTQTLPAANARALLNGLPISSESNTLSTAIDGLNITLLKASSPPATATIAVTQDQDAIKKAISDFTTAYNAINQLLRNQTKFDASSLSSDKSADAQKQAQLQRLSSLQGDSTAVGILNQLRGIMGGATSLGGSLNRLSDLGLAPGTDGNIPTSSTKLDTAMSKLDDLKKFFMGIDSSNDSNSGFATRIRSTVDAMLGTDGSVSSRQTAIQKQIDANNKEAGKMQDRADAMEKQLRQQYSALDQTYSKYSNLATYLTQQLSKLSS